MPDSSTAAVAMRKVTAAPGIHRNITSRTMAEHDCQAMLCDMQVRNLVATCLSRLYAAGDMLPLFSSVYALQTFLQDKNSTATEVRWPQHSKKQQCICAMRAQSAAEATAAAACVADVSD
jgi:hypothetical protein